MELCDGMGGAQLRKLRNVHLEVTENMAEEALTQEKVVNVG